MAAGGRRDRSCATRRALRFYFPYWARRLHAALAAHRRPPGRSRAARTIATAHFHRIAQHAGGAAAHLAPRAIRAALEWLSGTAVPHLLRLTIRSTTVPALCAPICPGTATPPLT